MITSEIELTRVLTVLVLSATVVACGGNSESPHATKAFSGGSNSERSPEIAEASPIGTTSDWVQARRQEALATPLNPTTKAEANTTALSRVYRFYNRTQGAHFYTISPHERNASIEENRNLNYEGIGFASSVSAGTNLAPVHRFLNRSTGTHFYTISEVERQRVQQSLGGIYSYEGVAWYGSPQTQQGWQPMYRFFNRSNGLHFYTASEAERNTVSQNTLYQYEGVAYHVRAANSLPPLQTTYLGTWEALSEAPLFVAIFGPDASKVTEVRMNETLCSYSIGKSTGALKTYQCTAPKVQGASQQFFYSRIKFSDGRESNVGPWYVTSLERWIEVNGQFWDNGPIRHVLIRNSDGTLEIPMSVDTFAGNSNDLPNWRYFSAALLQDNTGNIRCPASTTKQWVYVCPQVSLGRKSLRLEREFGAINLINSTHNVQVVSSAEFMDPLPAPLPTQAEPPPTTPPTTPGCNPETDKGCQP